MTSNDYDLMIFCGQDRQPIAFLFATLSTLKRWNAFFLVECAERVTQLQCIAFQNACSIPNVVMYENLIKYTPTKSVTYPMKWWFFLSGSVVALPWTVQLYFTHETYIIAEMQQLYFPDSPDSPDSLEPTSIDIMNNLMAVEE